MIKNIINNNNVMLTILLIMTLSLCVLGGMSHVSADERIRYDKSFISIELQDGDTLSSIAEEYALSPSEYRSYIAEVKSINNLKSDTIHSGCYLMIPVYMPVSQ